MAPAGTGRARAGGSGTAGTGDSTLVDLDGHRFTLTNLGKILYPAAGTTKAEVIGYYAAVAHLMVPHTAGRPCTRKRWPNGVESEPFFQKNVDAATPAWVRRVAIEHSSGPNIYPVVDNPATLAWMAQNAALEIHVPQWRFGADDAPQNPDRLVFDLDPGPGVGLAQCAEVAFAVRERLAGSGIDLPMVPVTSGSKGIHLYLALDGSLTSSDASDQARELAEAVERDMPSLVVSRMSKALRPGKVFIDWSQNNGNKTTIAPYSMRGRDRPTVAVPRTWDELAAPGLTHLEFTEVLERIAGSEADTDDHAQDADPMAGLEGGAPGPRAVARGGGPATPAGPDKLSTYRSMRSADRTPEPVPEPAALPQGNDDTFVIQEHHARRLHYDFRLERGGVLVSWAVPKNLPTDSRQNRLAVHTEDHPMDYASFAGDIPAGEYGGGHVEVWDSGTYVTEKWRDDEVIVVLSGRQVSGRFALIRTNGKNWLVHRMADHAPAAAGAPRRRQKASAASHPAPPAVKTSTVPSPAAGSGGAAAPTDLSPMLAGAGSLADLDPGTTWRLEGKWDGIRALVTVDAGGLVIRSRTGRDITAGYPELAGIAEVLAGLTVVLDGEIVAFTGGATGRTGEREGRSDFGLLQQRMNTSRAADVARLAGTVPVVFLAFDVLYLNGVSLLRKTLDDRRTLLEALHLDDDNWRTPARLVGDPEQALADSRTRGWEGIVAKKASSTYLPGKRAGTWLKLKNQRTQDVVVIGWKPGQGRRAGGIGSLLLAVPGPAGHLRYAGKVGTGFTEAVLDDLLSRLTPLRTARPPVPEVSRPEARDAVWVRPEVVGEVRFVEWTHDGHLRASSWRGVRPDVAPEQIVAQ